MLGKNSCYITMEDIAGLNVSVIVSSFGSIWRGTKDFSYILDWRQNQIGRRTFFQSLQEAVNQGHPTTVSSSRHTKHF